MCKNYHIYCNKEITNLVWHSTVPGWNYELYSDKRKRTKILCIMIAYSSTFSRHFKEADQLPFILQIFCCVTKT